MKKNVHNNKKGRVCKVVNFQNKGVTANPISAPYNVKSEGPRIIGLDIANSYVKMTSESGTITYPNTTKLLSEQQKKLIESEGRGGDVFTYVEDSGIQNHYQIGLTDKDVISSSSTSKDRYRSEQFRREFILALARIAQNGEVFAVVTGLPSSDYLDETNKLALKELAGRTYMVLVNGNPISFTISHVFVELQPRGTYLSASYQIINGQVFVKNEELATAKYVGVVDIGWGTTDFALLTEDGFIHEKVGISHAMSNAYELLKENLLEEYSALRDVPLIELEAEIRKKGTIWAGEGNIPKDVIERELTRAFAATANDIISKLKNAVNLDQLNIAVFTGGGVIALREHLRGKIDGTSRKVMVSNAQEANSEGYYIRGVLVKQQGGLNS